MATGNDAYTVLLLHMNANFNDTSLGDGNSPHTVTLLNTPTIDTSLASYPLTGETGAGKFVAASSQALSFPNSSDWNLSAGVFTIDVWVRFNSLPASGSNMRIVAQYQDSNDRWSVDILNTSGTYYLRLYAMLSGTSNNFSHAFTITTGTWYHIAIVQTASYIYLFLNGTEITSPASVVSMPSLTGSLYVAQEGNGASYLDGWLAELRISKGIARWTSNFTPPTAPYGPDATATGSGRSTGSANTVNAISVTGRGVGHGAATQTTHQTVNGSGMGVGSKTLSLSQSVKAVGTGQGSAALRISQVIKGVGSSRATAANVISQAVKGLGHGVASAVPTVSQVVRGAGVNRGLATVTTKQIVKCFGAGTAVATTVISQVVRGLGVSAGSAGLVVSQSVQGFGRSAAVAIVRFQGLIGKASSLIRTHLTSSEVRQHKATGEEY